METTRNAFSTAFFQGLVVVFFIYVVIFTVTIVQSRKPDATPGATLASADIAISRAVETTTEAVPHLDPTDQDPVPENTHTETPPADPAAEASAEDLIEVTPQGPLPKRSPTGLTPFNTYKKDFAHDGKPVIALAVLDYGLSETDSKQALQKLPSEVSLILSPYAATQDAWKSLASAEGHEFWMQMPLENQIYPVSEDPGPQALLVHTDFKNNQEKFLWTLTRTSGYVGIAGYTDAAFLNAQTALKTLWDEGYNRGMGFFEINPSGLEGVEMNAIEKQAPYVRNSSIYNETVQTPEQWLAALELEASNNGFAVGVIRNPYPKIVESIAGWAMGLPGRGFSLAPVSALAQANGDAAPPAETTPAQDDHAH